MTSWSLHQVAECFPNPIPWLGTTTFRYKNLAWKDTNCARQKTKQLRSPETERKNTIKSCFLSAIELVKQNDSTHTECLDSFKWNGEWGTLYLSSFEDLSVVNPMDCLAPRNLQFNLLCCRLGPSAYAIGYVDDLLLHTQNFLSVSDQILAWLHTSHMISFLPLEVILY